MGNFKTFAEFVKKKDWVKSENMGMDDDPTQTPDTATARIVTNAAARAMRSMQGRTVMKAVQGTDANAQKKLLTRTLSATSAKRPVDIGKVASVLDVSKPKAQV